MIPSISQHRNITKEHFGFLNGQEVFLYTLTNTHGNQVKISNYGATVTSWISKDKNGEWNSIVIGFDSLKEYLTKPDYHFGGIIGRFANRIAEGKFRVYDNEYKVTQNDGDNHIHGGSTGFDQVVWKVEVLNGTDPGLSLKYLSPDGEEGYPGNMNVEVIYKFTDANELVMEYAATTDKTTPINLTNHSYFNLTGNPETSILNHKLKINAESYIPTDKTYIPTGSIKSVKDTAYDFTKNKEIARDISKTEGGYDHCYILDKTEEPLQLSAILTDEVSGRYLEVYTTEPGMQFYSGNSLEGKIFTSEGIAIKKQSALCLETQHFPNSPNQKEFPTTILKPGETFRSTTKYKLGLML